MVVAVLVILTFLLIFSWLAYHFGYKILDAFSAVRKEYGTVVEKEYIPSYSKIIKTTVVRDSDAGFGSTSYEIPDQIEVPEEHIFHIKLNENFIVTPVKAKLYDRINQGEQVLVKYSQGRFSKRIYLKAIKHMQSR